MAPGTGKEAWAGMGAFEGGQMKFFHSWRSPLLTPQCALAYKGQGGWAWTAEIKSTALRGILKLLLPGQVICSGSNYLNIFTGDEGNEGARKGGMGGKNCFSNYNEVIKKILETRTLLYTASLPLPPPSFITFYKGVLGRLFIFDHSGINLQMYKRT